MEPVRRKREGGDDLVEVLGEALGVALRADAAPGVRGAERARGARAGLTRTGARPREAMVQQTRGNRCRCTSNIKNQVGLGPCVHKRARRTTNIILSKNSRDTKFEQPNDRAQKKLNATQYTGTRRWRTKMHMSHARKTHDEAYVFLLFLNVKKCNAK